MSAESDTKNVWLWILGTTVLIVALLVSFTFIVNSYIDDPAKRGQFGDQFGAMNALFSGLAFFGLILTIAFQARDINLQRKDLRLQTEALHLQNEALKLQIQEFKEQKDEMRKSARAQEKANELKIKEMKLTVGRMKLDLDCEHIKLQTDPNDRRTLLNHIENDVHKLTNDLEL